MKLWIKIKNLISESFIVFGTHVFPILVLPVLLITLSTEDLSQYIVIDNDSRFFTIFALSLFLIYGKVVKKTDLDLLSKTQFYFGILIGVIGALFIGDFNNVLLKFVIFFLIFSSACNYEWYFIRLGKLNFFSKRILFSKIIQFIIIGIGILIGMNIYYAFLAIILAQLFVAYPVLKKNIHLSLINISSKFNLREVIIYSLSYYLSTSFPLIDIFIAKNFLSDLELANLGITLKIFRIIPVLGLILSNRSFSKSILKFPLIILLITSGLSSVFAIFIADYGLDVLNTDYSLMLVNFDSIILTFSVLFASYNVYYLNSKALQKIDPFYLLKTYIVAFLVHLIFCYFLFTYFGATGLYISYLLTQVVIFLYIFKSNES